jgi:hypothetical protein
MIQTVAENKYSFNMRVSAVVMAALDRDYLRPKLPLVRQFLTSGFNQLAFAAAARIWGRSPTDRPLGRRMRSAILCLRKPAALAAASLRG